MGVLISKDKPTTKRGPIEKIIAVWNHVVTTDELKRCIIVNVLRVLLAPSGALIPHEVYNIIVLLLLLLVDDVFHIQATPVFPLENIFQIEAMACLPIL